MMRITKYLLLSVFFAAALSAEAADRRNDSVIELADLSLEDLMKIEIGTVFGASKFFQNVTDAPSSVSIVTSEDIKRFGYRSLADILRSTRGFNITYPRDYSYAGVRGFGRPGDYNSRILVTIDGHRTNENLYDMAYLGDEFMLDADLIDRVEIIRGPGSSLYGSNAFLAVINVITKNGLDINGAEMSAEAGSFRHLKGRGSYGESLQSGTDIIMSVTGRDSRGDNLYFRQFDPAYSSDPRATNRGIAHGTSFARNYNLFTKISKLGFTLEAGYSSRTKGIPTGAYLTDFNDPSNKYLDTRGYVDLKYERSINKDTDITARLYYDLTKYIGDYPGYVIYGAMNRSIAKGTWWGSEIGIDTRVFDIHRLNMGLEYINNFRKDHTNFDVDPYYVYDNNKRESHIWAFHLQDEIRPVKNLIINAGLRYDHYCTFGGTFNPRLALIYQPTDKSAVKAIYGTAFRAPNDYEMLYENVDQAANPELKSEKIKTYELVYEHYVGDHFRLSASGYYYKILGLIESVPTESDPNVTIYRNSDSVRASGFELELEKNWDSGLKGRLSYTFQWTKDKESGQRLTNSPKHMAKFNMLIPVVKDKIFTGIEEQYTSRRRTLAGDVTGAFFITNLTLTGQNILKGLDLSASVYNLFNNKYHDPGLEAPSEEYAVVDKVQQDGATFRVKLTYRF